MKVRKSSWHYRLWRFGRESNAEPRDLCRYFWHLALVKVLIPTILAGMVLFGIGSLVWVIVKNPLMSLVVVLLALLGVALAVGLYLLISHLVEERRRNPRQPQPKKEPSVTRQYLAARKRKVCPLIEVVDDRQTSQS